MWSRILKDPSLDSKKKTSQTQPIDFKQTLHIVFDKKTGEFIVSILYLNF